MKKAVSKQTYDKEDMKPEYDFSSMKIAARGKYYKAYRAGHKVVIHQADGTTQCSILSSQKGRLC
jgi:hypothetical protein